MQIRTSNVDGVVDVEVIDASDGAVTHSIAVPDGQRVTVTATSAHSPADLEVGEVEAIPDESEVAGEAADAAEDEAGEKAAADQAPESPEAGDGGNGNTVSGSGDAPEDGEPTAA